MISRLHYITPEDAQNYVALVQEVCEAGVDWVQLRIKNKSKEEIIAIGKQIKPICASFNAIFVVNDSVEICEAIDADGVHLGRTDGSLLEARRTLGNKKIIGATVNTFEHILQVKEQKAVDYMGLGPFRFTSTKKNLSPILGESGILQILETCRAHQIEIPTVVIGGIVPADVAGIMNAGAHGVAVISAINQAKNKKEVIQKFYTEIGRK